MTNLPLIAIGLALYLGSATVVTLPLAYWFRSRGWAWFQLALLVLPFGFWLSAVMASSKGKSLTNAVAEPLLCGCTVLVPVVLRIAAPTLGWWPGIAYGTGLLISCAVAALIYGAVPPLPE